MASFFKKMNGPLRNTNYADRFFLEGGAGHGITDLSAPLILFRIRAIYNTDTK